MQNSQQMGATQNAPQQQGQQQGQGQQGQVQQGQSGKPAQPGMTITDWASI